MKNNISKLFYLVAYLAFAAVSCWATAESLHLLLPSWPIAMSYVVTAGLFFIASWGTKLIVDSFNQHVYLENRGRRLFFGVLILILFWLICSMPTNTHTFFYRNVISEKVSNDILTTQNYLGQIINNSKNQNQIDAKIAELNNKVEIKLGELKSEIENDANPGFGPRAKEILHEFAELLGVAKIDALSLGGTSVGARKKLYESYRSKIYILCETRENNIRKNIQTPNPDLLKQAKIDSENLELTKTYISDGRLDLNLAEDIAQVCDKLNSAYATINNGKDFVTFQSENDETNYTRPNAVTKVKRTTSVFDTWKDFIAGEYAGHGFLFWIIISILVDVAAFIFFDFAFKNEN